jgi:hypothetical protein
MIQCRRSALRSRIVSLLSVASIPVFIAVLIGLAGAISAGAQSPAPQSRITRPIDETNLVTLHGNTHPLARAQYDQGAAPDNLPAARIQLLLQRSPEQETALRQLLDEQKSASSPNFHQWLTPAQFGQQFGPSDADIATVTAWLQSHGFTVNRVSAGRTVIEVSGNAGQVREAFHTEIHKYVVNGESHWANNSDPQIPEALQPVVAGFVSLNNFPKRPQYHLMGRILPRTTSANPLETEPNRCLTANGTTTNCYAVAPADFATIYNVLPLWDQMVTVNSQSVPLDGTGQTIAIVGETDINCQDIINFRTFYGLLTVPNDTCSQPSSYVQIILDGPDPGYQGDEIEADLDVEWSGAVAKGAHIDFVTSETTDLTQGIDLSAEYIVDNNLAPVMSESYGECEAFLLAAGNQFYYQLWEQAAAQGITVITSAGDSGSAGCDNENNSLFAQDGANVSGLNSTPFNVSAGGTDFNDVSNPPTFWNAANSTISTGQTQESAKGYIPEIPWDDSCAASGVATACSTESINQDTFVTGGLNIVGAGGGQSNCVLSVVVGQFIDCETNTTNPAGGYPKPAWQKGSAVTGLANTDGVRDVPDISLYAASGSFSNSFYPICQSDQNTNNASCTSISTFIGVGGTSSSAPAFAGIMAMVNQYMASQSMPSRQGNANYELYTLADNQVTTPPSGGCNTASSPNTTTSTGCTFYDITTGSNSVPCEGASYGCSNTSSSSTLAGVVEQAVISTGAPDGTVAWNAGTGYDFASGLGSVNAYNLVHNWPAVVGAFKGSQATLQLCTGGNLVCQSGGSATALTFVHGTTITVNVGVSAASGFTGTPSGNTALLGTPDTLSNTNGNSAVGTSAAVDIFRFGTSPLNLDVYTLGSGGTVSGTTTYLAGGQYSVTTHYNGDDIFGASDSAAVKVNITPENSAATLSSFAYSPAAQSYETLSAASSVPYGTAELFRLDVKSASSGQETATGTVTFTDEGVAIPQTSVNDGKNEPFTLNSEGFAEVQTPLYGLFSNNTQESAYVIQPLSVGSHSIQANYIGAQSSFVAAGAAGDASYNQSQTTAFALTVTKAATAIVDAPSTVISGTSTCSNNASSSFTLGSSVTIAALVETTSFANIPTGTVAFVSSKGENVGTVSTSPFYDPNNGYSELCASVTYIPTATETITASYGGDGNYAVPAASAMTTITSGSAFSITSSPNSTSATAAQISAPGASGQSTIGITLTGGSVTLSASLFSEPSGAVDPPTCSFLPNPVTANGNVVMTCTTTAATASVPPSPTARPQLPRAPIGWLLAAIVAALAVLVLLAMPGRRRGYALLVFVLVVAAGAGVACGGGGGGIAGGGGGGGNPGTTTGLYEYTVSGTPAGGTTTVWFNVN